MSEITKKTIIIFGKNGQVASDLINLLNLQTKFKFIYYSSLDADFTDVENLANFLSKLPKCHYIINACAYNKVDDAQDNIVIADKINHLAVAEIANHCAKNNIIFIHYSTNYVFNGNNKAANKEDDIQFIKPLSIYAKSKYQGELAVINAKCQYLILRVATVFNKSKEDNFIAKIKKLSQERSNLNIVFDQLTNPTNSIDIAKSTIDIIAQLNENDPRLNKIYHLASNRIISYYDFVKEFLPNSNNKITINPVATSDFKVKAPRPLNGGLDVSKIKEFFNIDFDINLN